MNVCCGHSINQHGWSGCHASEAPEAAIPTGHPGLVEPAQVCKCKVKPDEILEKTVQAEILAFARWVFDRKGVTNIPQELTTEYLEKREEDS